MMKFPGEMILNRLLFLGRNNKISQWQIQKIATILTKVRLAFEALKQVVCTCKA